ERTVISPARDEVGRILVPKEIGEFTLEEQIGSGGMGVVFRARDRAGRSAALKLMMRPDNPQFLKRFEREANIRISHPNIIEVFDSGVTADGLPYIAFELLGGETLAERLQRGALTVPAAIELAKQVCRGLAAAHAQGVVHRDLKPANLFICAGGGYKLLDFGI